MFHLAGTVSQTDLLMFFGLSVYTTILSLADHSRFLLNSVKILYNLRSEEMASRSVNIYIKNCSSISEFLSFFYSFLAQK